MEWNEGLKGKKIVVVDTETTGLCCQEGGACDRILEIAAVKYEEMRPVERFHSYVACPVPLSEEVAALTGITDEMLAGAPPVGEVLARFAAFCEGCVLVGYNLAFDCKFLEHYGRECGAMLPQERLDLLPLARRLLEKEEVESYAFQAVALCCLGGASLQTVMQCAEAAGKVLFALWRRQEQGSCRKEEGAPVGGRDGADEFAATCCFTGPRPKNYPWGTDETCAAKMAEKLKAAVYEAVGRGYRHFISGMAAGVDLLAAKIVLQMREDMPQKGITLEAAIPFPSQPMRWEAETKREYQEILSRCDRMHCAADTFSLAAYRRRDEYMVDRSSLLIAVGGAPGGGTARTIAYAQMRGRAIVLLNVRG